MLAKYAGSWWSSNSKLDKIIKNFKLKEME